MSWTWWLILALLDNKQSDMLLAVYGTIVRGAGLIIAFFFFSSKLWNVSDKWLCHQDISSWSRCQKREMREEALCKGQLAISFEVKFEREKY